MTTSALAGPGRTRTLATSGRAAASLPRDFAPGTAAAPAQDRPSGPEGHCTTGEGA